MAKTLACRRPVCFLLLAAALVSLTACATTDTGGRVTVEDRNARIAVVFGDRERRAMYDYYRSRKVRGLPPGLAKQGEVPPGHAKRPARAERLPDDVRGRRLPRDLERQLSRLPDEYVRLRIGTDVVLLHRNSRVVLDMVRVPERAPA